ncbi:MAG TPA: gamma-glutamylcyclotransferase [Saprospiraceae bacterium]|nr:gamma-glutamylcyclotransferase [Saprospiraceae bacterium]HMQ82855.1 gamma-glutamylcyclotransferase [Saprospiraceae bacterium]
MQPEYLFVYGTLKDDEVLTLLLGAPVPKQKALLHGYAVHVNPDGYFFLLPAEQGILGGFVLQLSLPQLQQIDRWEEVPHYFRFRTLVVLADGTHQACWVYTGHFESCGLAPTDALAMKDREGVLLEVKASLQKNMR